MFGVHLGGGVPAVDPLRQHQAGGGADPVPAPEEIVVDVHAASVNAADYKVRLGGRGYNLQFPHILGRDFSGVVAKTGEGVTDFAVGD